MVYCNMSNPLLSLSGVAMLDIKPIVIKSTEDETLIQLILPIKTY